MSEVASPAMPSDVPDLCRLSGTTDPAFLTAAARLLEDLSAAPDAECLELSRAAERDYLLCHLYRGRQNLELICRGLARTAAGAGRKRVLDIGTAPLTFLYAACLPDVSMHTIDLTPLLAARCRRLGIEHRPCNLGREPFPFSDAGFDLVAFTEVMEHLAIAPGRVFVEIRRILRPGGFLLLSLPNLANLKNRLKFLLGRPLLSPIYRVFRAEEPPELEPEAVRVHGLGHVREYTMSETCDIVRHYGFEVVETRCMDSFRVPPAGMSTAKRFGFGLYRVAAGLVPHSRLINAVLARRK